MSDANAANLRQAQVSDFDEVACWFRSPDELKTWGGPKAVFPFDRSQFATMVEQSLQIPPERLCLTYEVGGRICGHVQAALDHVDKVARLGRIAIAPQCRRSSHGRQMLETVIGRVLDQGFNRLELSVYSENAAAISLYRTLGFEVEGTRKKAAIFSHGVVDVHIMALLRTTLKS